MTARLLFGLSILIVDDEPAVCRFLTRALERSGAEVRVADGAEAARSILATHTPDLIVSDITMPNEDGYSLIRSIRTLERSGRASVPAVALTALSLPSDRARALDAGFNRHLVKPILPSTLVNALREVVGTHSVEGDNGASAPQSAGAPSSSRSRT